MQKRLRKFISFMLACCWLAPVIRAAEPAESPETFFELKIRPVLAKTCFKCHGGDKTENDLRVDSRDALTKGGETGAAIVAGKPDESLLIQAIKRTGDLAMPPDEKLPAAVVADFEQWIRTGATWPSKAPSGPDLFQRQRHWAFQPVKDVAIPVDPTGWAETPVDRFIAAKLHEQGLAPVEQADKRTLLRRAYFDLIGLPPTYEETEAFLADDAPDAFANVVERLLGSPQYGERWGRHWMDVARYADTAGDNADYPVPEARLYRDYIIDAFNADKPFNQFVREQLAGDILAASGPLEKYSEQVIATGFVALSRRYATAPYELMHLTLEDSIDTVGRAFLGLSLRCARCHDHKLDPVTTADYYSLYAIFANTKYPYAGSEEFNSMNFPRMGFMPLTPVAKMESAWSAYRQEGDRLRALIKQAESDKKPDAEIRRLKKQLRDYDGRGLPPGVEGAYAVCDGPPVETHIQRRGEPSEQGDKVTPAVPAFLAGGKPIAFPPNTSGRLQLADWLASDANPLTPRVIVNRIWQQHFGTGIVATPSNFGMSGASPAQPQLLDWLTRDFIQSGWSIKHVHRQIMLSKTYQLSSRIDAACALADPDNHFCWRHDSRRLDAEAIRDAMLFVSGTLDLARPGAHPFPPIKEWGWSQHMPFKAVYPSMHRSVYLMTQRLQRHPFLALFDGPDTNTTTEQRSESTVPLQALFLMNSPFVREAADGLAGRVFAAATPRPERIAQIYQLAYTRRPTEAESARGAQYLETYTREIKRAHVADAAVEREAWISYARILLSADEFFYLD